VDERLRDADGEPLLFLEDIEALAGWTHETVKAYATAGNRARAEGNATPRHMPAAVRRVRKTKTKGNGKPLVVWVSLYRRDEVMKWLEERGVRPSDG
jgi:hypothetical protein